MWGPALRTDSWYSFIQLLSSSVRYDRVVWAPWDPRLPLPSLTLTGAIKLHITQSVMPSSSSCSLPQSLGAQAWGPAAQSFSPRWALHKPLSLSSPSAEYEMKECTVGVRSRHSNLGTRSLPPRHQATEHLTVLQLCCPSWQAYNITLLWRSPGTPGSSPWPLTHQKRLSPKRQSACRAIANRQPRSHGHATFWYGISLPLSFRLCTS